MTTNPFEKHAIDHISASSLRMFRENQAVWCARYLLKIKDEGGPRAWRGTAVEAGLDHYLFTGGTFDECLTRAEMAFEAKVQGEIDQEIHDEQEQLRPFLTQAIAAFENKGIPLTRQSAIKVTLPGIEVPVTGFTDYRYATHAYDLKTSYRVPSVATPAHVEQMSIYMLSTGLPFTLVYASPKKWAAYEVTPQMAAEAYDRVFDAALAMRCFLAKVEDARDALSIIAPDYEHYYFTDEMRKAVRETRRPIDLPAAIAVKQ